MIIFRTQKHHSGSYIHSQAISEHMAGNLQAVRVEIDADIIHADDGTYIARWGRVHIGNFVDIIAAENFLASYPQMEQRDKSIATYTNTNP